ncbi:MAG: hypothetical protein WKF77_31215 [Planctomycetaceae bacterium]
MTTESQTQELIADTATRHFTDAQSIFDSQVQDGELMCRIYDTYAGPEEAHHNCLGCNFSDLTKQISKYLKIAAANSDFQLHHEFSIFAFLINTCWERITDVFDILGVPDGYRCQYFAPFIRSRRWANFFKHPKTFGWMVHHPHYTIENSDDHKHLSREVGKYRFIDDEFLKKYYSAGPDKNAGKPKGESASKLKGKFVGFEKNTVVIVPDVSQLTTEICRCLDHFVNIITENPIYIEMLNDTSTIEDFYESYDETDDETGIIMTQHNQ